MKTDAEQPLLIIGAGVGGLALALALREHGVRATIWERAEELREVGAGLLLTPNAVRVLRRLHVFEAVAARGCLARRWQILDRRGAVLQTFRFGESSVSLSLARAELQRVLHERLPAQCLALGHEVISITTSDIHGSVAVQTARGLACRAALVVGADGAHSVVRAQVANAAPPRTHGYVGWRALVDDVPALWRSGLITESWGDGCRFGIAPVSATRCYWYATENLALDHAPPRASWKAHLRERFRAWHPPIGDLLAATPNDAILLGEIADYTAASRIGRGSVTLLGDAAHLMTPNLGQGAAMALEDAVTLAGCLGRDGLTSSALRRYEASRRRRTASVAWLSRQIGRLIQLENPALCTSRDFALRLTPDRLAQLALAPVFDFRAG